MDKVVEHELCANCKKDIPQPNYVMHTMHCARNITLCKNCNEPIPKLEYEQHREACRPKPVKKPSPPPIALEKSSYFQTRRAVEEQKIAKRKELYMKKHEHLIDDGFTLRESVRNNLSSSTSSNRSLGSSSSSLSSGSTGSTVNSISNATYDKSAVVGSNAGGVGGGVNKSELEQKRVESFQQQSVIGSSSKKSSGLLACRYCDLELPKLELEEHENYCGTRTDKCLECGELVMFKNKQVHVDSNHGFVKLTDEPGPRPSWESSTQRSSTSSSANASEYSPRRRFERLRLDDAPFDPTPYLPSVYVAGFNTGGGPKKKEGESYKEISRRLDCKTEYIRNLLHDSASITAPLRRGGMPRNHFNHNKGPAPQPPSRRRNPPTELTIPCEFCDTPIPHEDLILHETGCRPDLARLRLKRNRASTPEDHDYAASSSTPARDYNSSVSRDYTSSAPTRDYNSAGPRDYNSSLPTRDYNSSRPRDYGSRDERDDEELPCEFCEHMIPASELWKHQLSCTPA